VRRRSLAGAALAALGGAALFLVRGQPHEHVDVYLEDGSLVSFKRGAEAERLLEPAREILEASR
jgi:hypothetical protein